MSYVSARQQHKFDNFLRLIDYGPPRRGSLHGIGHFPGNYCVRMIFANNLHSMYMFLLLSASAVQAIVSGEPTTHQYHSEHFYLMHKEIHRSIFKKRIINIKIANCPDLFLGLIIFNC